ncbi:hypothetical protein [Rhizohabitans arisaemae]|uniref:hypothetical protein n=1 Tax=Rhizohabitans arisaemae TaxID=2720610 RepID=UPI0024B141FE|nr:hypothetical protein [Rhizohabitans arisaemae]
MIRRLFYMSLGAAIAIWALRKLQSLSPGGLAHRAAHGALGVLGAAREFAADVREGAARREIELRAELGLDTVSGISGLSTHQYVKDGR